MGVWMTLPETESSIEERTSRFWAVKRGWRMTGLDRISGLVANFDRNDVANMADVCEVPLWECEVPLTARSSNE